MNQGKLKVVKQEMAWVNIDIFGISELKKTWMGKFNSDDHCIYFCGQESFRRNGVALIVNKESKMQYMGAISKMKEWSPYVSKPFNITVIQVYVPTSYAEEAEVEWFYEALQELLELTLKKRCPFHHRGLECKSRKSTDT